MKNASYFTLKTIFVIEILTFLSGFFGYAEKRFDKKVEVYFKINDVTAWITNSYNTCIVQYLKN